MRMGARAVAIIAGGGGGGTPPVITDEYRSPTGFKYFQPDGSSVYKQP
jgi:hypothetical protein